MVLRVLRACLYLERSQCAVRALLVVFAVVQGIEYHLNHLTLVLVNKQEKVC